MSNRTVLAVVDVEGTWKFEGSESGLYLKQTGVQLTGAFRSGDGKLEWKIKGTVDGQGNIKGYRYIPVAEMRKNGLPENALQAVVARYRTDKPGFIRGDFSFNYDAEKQQFNGYYVTHSATWDKRTGVLDRVDEKRVQLKLLKQKEKPQLRFVTREDGQYVELGKQLHFYGGPIFMEARYQKKQKDEEISLELKWQGSDGEETTELSAKAVDPAMLVYRSSPFFIMPPDIPNKPVEPLVSP